MLARIWKSKLSPQQSADLGALLKKACAANQLGAAPTFNDNARALDQIARGECIREELRGERHGGAQGSQKSKTRQGEEDGDYAPDSDEDGDDPGDFRPTEPGETAVDAGASASPAAARARGENTRGQGRGRRWGRSSSTQHTASGARTLDGEALARQLRQLQSQPDNMRGQRPRKRRRVSGRWSNSRLVEELEGIGVMIMTPLLGPLPLILRMPGRGQIPHRTLQQATRRPNLLARPQRVESDDVAAEISGGRWWSDRKQCVSETAQAGGDRLG